MIMYRHTVAVVPAIFIESGTLHTATIHKCWLVAENKLLLIHLPEYKDQRCPHVEEVSRIGGKQVKMVQHVLLCG